MKARRPPSGRSAPSPGRSRFRPSPWASFGRTEEPRPAEKGSGGSSAGTLDQEPAQALSNVEVPEGALRVVMVDDDLRIRTLTRMLFERSTQARIVAEAADGDQVFDLLHTAEPDVVLLDLLMQRVDGRTVLPQLVREAPETMVLVLSALSGIDEADRTFALGAFAYLEKSVVGPELPDQIKELHGLFQRAIAGETVWSPAGPPRIRR